MHDAWKKRSKFGVRISNKDSWQVDELGTQSQNWISLGVVYILLNQRREEMMIKKINIYEILQKIFKGTIGCKN